MVMKKKGEKVEKKEEISEDWCFQCYEGGSLLVCDYKDCLKAYHVDCVRKDDESFTESDDSWFCRRHSCYQCKKSSKYQCCGCPNAVCKNCMDKVDFARIKGKALCHHCVKLALLGEEGMDVDSDGECVDFQDLETFEGLFYDYWKKVVKEKEGFTLEDLQSADVQIQKGGNYNSVEKSKDSDNEEEFQPIIGSDDEDDNNYDDDDDDVDDINDDNNGVNNGDDTKVLKPKLVHKRKREKNLGTNRRLKSKSEIPKSRREIVSWGSKPLLDFLTSIGEDTSKRYEPYKIAYMIHRYADENKLIHTTKPRKILCDEKLKCLLGRKIVDKNKIVDLLEPHYPEYLESSEEEEEKTKSSPKQKEENAPMVSCKKEKILITHKKSEEPVRGPQSYFAFIISENIKLVFLKKSLVQEMLKEPESFESKVVGSFVRVKLDMGIGSRRYFFQLLQVTGINKTEKEVLLQVTTVTKDISINLLSDDYFSEEECEDLRKKVKDGLIRRPTIVDLEQKAGILHDDITKHWIAKELVTLQNRIDNANEKGRRREFFECCERQRLLQTPEEQSRLLRKVPNIIPDMTDNESMAKNVIKEHEKEENISRKLNLVESPETPSSVEEENGTSSEEKEAAKPDCTVNLVEDNNFPENQMNVLLDVPIKNIIQSFPAPEEKENNSTSTCFLEVVATIPSCCSSS